MPKEVARMRRYLVVANRTLAGGRLVETLLELQASGPCAFHVLVPATPPTDHAWTEAEARRTAAGRLATALQRFRDAGLQADGEVGDEHPTQAIADVLERGETFDGVVLSTLPPKLSRWLKLDLPHRIESMFELPVTHVIGHPEPEFHPT